MRILVLGGTRFFGREVVRMLVDNGHDVTVLSRGVSPIPFSSDEIVHLRSDRNMRGAVAAALDGQHYDAVFDNSAMLGDAVRDVLSAVSLDGPYVLTSSGAVYHRPGELPLEYGDASFLGDFDPFRMMRPIPEEAAPFEPTWLREEASRERAGYRRGKLEAEAVLSEHMHIPGIRPVVIRPPQIEGPRDPTGRTEFFFRRIQDESGVLLPADRRGGVFQKVSSIDLARAVCAIIEDTSDAISGAYNVAAEEIYTMERYLNGLAWIRGHSPPTIHWICPDHPDESRSSTVEDVPIPTPKVLNTRRIHHAIGWNCSDYRTWMGQTLEWIAARPLPAGYARRRAREREILRACAGISPLSSD